MRQKLFQKKFIWMFLFVFILFLFLPCLGEEENEEEKEMSVIFKFIKKKRINAAYLIGGGNLLALNKLNLNLQERGFPQVSQNYFAYGFGGHFIQDKVVVGVELIKIMERTTDAATSYNLAFSGRLYLLEFGHLVYQEKGLMMYPFAGVGLGKITLITSENNIDSFNDISNLQRSSTSKLSNIILNCGFGVDYFFNYNTKKKGHNNVIIGIRAGYNFTPTRNNWTVNRIEVADGPQTGITGPYFRVMIGLGGWMEKFIKIAIKS